jgi:hypothetical protein
VTPSDRKSPLEIAVAALERILLCVRGEEPSGEGTDSRIERYAEEALERLRPELARRLALRRVEARPHPIMQGPDRPCPDPEEPEPSPPPPKAA